MSRASAPNQAVADPRLAGPSFARSPITVDDVLAEAEARTREIEAFRAEGIEAHCRRVFPETMALIDDIACLPLTGGPLRREEREPGQEIRLVHQSILICLRGFAGAVADLSTIDDHCLGIDDRTAASRIIDSLARNLTEIDLSAAEALAPELSSAGQTLVARLRRAHDDRIAREINRQEAIAAAEAAFRPLRDALALLTERGFRMFDGRRPVLSVERPSGVSSTVELHALGDDGTELFLCGVAYGGDTVHPDGELETVMRRIDPSIAGDRLDTAMLAMVKTLVKRGLFAPADGPLDRKVLLVGIPTAFAKPLKAAIKRTETRLKNLFRIQQLEQSFREALTPILDDLARLEAAGVVAGNGAKIRGEFVGTDARRFSHNLHEYEAGGPFPEFVLWIGDVRYRYAQMQEDGEALWTAHLHGKGRNVGRLHWFKPEDAPILSGEIIEHVLERRPRLRLDGEAPPKEA